MIKTGKPSSLSSQLKVKNTRNTRFRRYEPRKTKLQITNESYINTGIRLLNILPEELLNTEKDKQFRKDLKIWIRNNIPIKPYIYEKKITFFFSANKKSYYD